MSLSPAWRYRLAALAAGLGAALAHPPFGFLPGLLGYALLLWLSDRSSRVRSAFFRGWLAGLGYFAISTWWVAEAFFVDMRQAWMAPFAVTFLAAGLALFWGGAAALYRFAAPKGATRVLVFAGSLAAFEWLRGHVLTGFPWDLPGESWRAGSAPSQFASVVGAYGLTWITVAIFSAAALWRESRKAVLVAVVGLAGLYGFGAWRLANAVEGEGPLVRIVQPMVEQSAKYDMRLFEEIVARYVTLTQTPAARTPDIVIWPEGAIPAAINDYLAPGTWTLEAVAGALEPRQTLLVGAYRIEGEREDAAYYNSLAALRFDGRELKLTGLYDKHRLVPFGEYMPMDEIMSKWGVKQMVHVGDGFTPALPPSPIAPAGIPALQPLICYESLFPGFTRKGATRSGVRPAWIVNVSNDAWFGQTSGPRQHLNLAAYRAIEEGLPMARSTPTGVSAMIDAYGRVVKRLELGRAGVLDVALPAPAPTTLYRRWGEWPFGLMLGLSFLLAARIGAKARLNKRRD
ncbi:MAG TPA: apolipoprotein N-acyltransferase [Caulobacteraceae bacterium]|nr:apolipoprotein N-acyltransferase [Caulobacteraceae bacterium]